MKPFPTISCCCLSLLVTGLAGKGLVAQEAAVAPSAAANEVGEPLIPAAFGIWTDRAGSSWSVEAGGNIGRIGSTMVNSGLALLIDEEKFTPYQPMMTPDGKEMVLQGLPLEAFPGLQMQRRVRLLDEQGGLRYVELFHNGSSDPLTLSIGLTTNFSGNFKTFLSDRGRSEPLLLTPAETGVVVLPGSSQSSRAFLFTLAGTGGGDRPTISSQNRYGLTFRYRLDLAAGETGVILHHVAQVVIPQNFDRRTLAELSRPHQLDGIREGLESEWLPFLVNAPEQSGLSARSAFAEGGLSLLGLEAGAHDLLAIGDATRLSGSAAAESLQLSTPYGEAEFPLERLAAIQGGKTRPGGAARLFLRDGQVLSGQLEAAGLHFVPINGSRMELDPATLDRLILAGGKATPRWPDETAAVIETHAGDRIRVTKSEALSIPLMTAWGSLAIPLGDLLWLHSDLSGGPGYRAELKDGTRVAGLVDGASLAVSGSGLGDIDLPSGSIRHLYTEAGIELGDEEMAPVSGSVVKLPGGQQVAGAVSHTTFPIVADGTALEIPVTELRRISRIEPGINEEVGPRYQFERWDGGVVAGRLALEFLSVQVGGRTWQIPLRDVVAVALASPSLDPATLTRIETLIRGLGSPEWSTRESATRELGAFGYLARPVLQRELATTDDPEVERRLERVLSGLN